jgi:methyltransferase (TIGR00027 family)
VEKVQDTANWVAMVRAEESERRDALFKDPLARMLAGKTGTDVGGRLRALGAWPIVARTLIIDRLISEAVRDGADAIVNLAAGFDARPYRLKLPRSLVWIEVDHADLIADKEVMLRDVPPVCQLERVALDLSLENERRGLLSSMARRFRRIVVLSEGLLCYLEPGDAMGLARDIRETPGVLRYIADLANKAVNDFIARRTRNGLAGTASLKFGSENGPLVFEPLGWKVVSATSIFKTAGQLKRLPFPMSLFARLPEKPYGSPGRPWSAVCVWEPC